MVYRYEVQTWDSEDGNNSSYHQVVHSGFFFNLIVYGIHSIVDMHFY